MKKVIGLIVSVIITLSLCACSWLQNHITLAATL